MTKEELMQLSDEGNLTQHELENFFKSNICIPKGEDRHPYADELHSFIEGIPIQQQFIENGPWYDGSTAISYFDLKYRIKPQEPVYEWQWVVIYNGAATITKEFFTEKEFWDTHSSLDFIDTAYIVDGTKRIRK
jgi:hypothetical protein